MFKREVRRGVSRLWAMLSYLRGDMKGRDCIEEFIIKHVHEGDCVFDIGANQGQYASLMAKIVGVKGKVHAFEANPEIIRLLTDNMNAPNVEIHNIAVSDTMGKKPFFIDTRDSMGGIASSLNVLEDLHATGKVREIVVQCTTLDAFCTHYDLFPKLIKIDVEGHELQVIRGSAQTIARHRPYIIFEFWETWWNCSIREVFEFLTPAYTLTRLQDGVGVEKVYYTYQGQGVVDIGCSPRADWRSKNTSLNMDGLFLRDR